MSVFRNLDEDLSVNDADEWTMPTLTQAAVIDLGSICGSACTQVVRPDTVSEGTQPVRNQMVQLPLQVPIERLSWWQHPSCLKFNGPGSTRGVVGPR